MLLDYSGLQQKLNHLQYVCYLLIHLQAAVFFLVAIALEFVVGLLKEGKSIIRLSDGISSMTAGMFMVLTRYLNHSK